jgi:hypothetical protein
LDEDGAVVVPARPDDEDPDELPVEEVDGEEDGCWLGDVVEEEELVEGVDVVLVRGSMYC